MKKLLTASLLSLVLLFGLNGNAFAGFSPNIAICHCPEGHGGTKCIDVTLNTQGAYNGHFANHSFDHEGACTADELAGADEGLTDPKTGSADWREQ